MRRGGFRNPRTLSFFTYVFFSCPFGMWKYLPWVYKWGLPALRHHSELIHPPIRPVGPSIQTYNLSFRVCVMCLRTTTESRGGNRLALCCSPTLTWYDPAPSLLCIQWGWRTANCTTPLLPEPVTCTCAILNQPFIRLRKGRYFNDKQKQQ